MELSQLIEACILEAGQVTLKQLAKALDIEISKASDLDSFESLVEDATKILNKERDKSSFNSFRFQYLKHSRRIICSANINYLNLIKKDKLNLETFSIDFKSWSQAMRVVFCIVLKKGAISIGEIDNIRGVNSFHCVLSLVDLGIISSSKNKNQRLYDLSERVYLYFNTNKRSVILDHLTSSKHSTLSSLDKVTILPEKRSGHTISVLDI